MTPDDLKARTKQFSLRILDVCDALSGSYSGRIVGNQLGRSGTSVAANYRASCKARSRAEFIAKLGVVEEEADESVYWLEVVVERNMLTAHRVAPLLAEAKELAAIMAQSRITAARNRNPSKNR